jgi:hypothetical protein
VYDIILNAKEYGKECKTVLLSTYFLNHLHWLVGFYIRMSSATSGFGLGA